MGARLVVGVLACNAQDMRRLRVASNARCMMRGHMPGAASVKLPLHPIGQRASPLPAVARHLGQLQPQVAHSSGERQRLVAKAGKGPK
jgi:hypothetical protein